MNYRHGPSAEIDRRRPLQGLFAPLELFSRHAACPPLNKRHCKVFTEICSSALCTVCRRIRCVPVVGCLCYMPRASASTLHGSSDLAPAPAAPAAPSRTGSGPCSLTDRTPAAAGRGRPHHHAASGRSQHVAQAARAPSHGASGPAVHSGPSNGSAAAIA
jgi:hypothetical protein